MSTIISAVPQEVDLVLYRGDDFRLPAEFSDAAGAPINMTGWTFRAQVRERAGSIATPVILAVDTANAATGRLVIVFDRATTANLPTTSEWDLEATFGVDGQRRTYLRGKITMRGDVSR